MQTGIQIGIQANKHTHIHAYKPYIHTHIPIIWQIRHACIHTYMHADRQTRMQTYMQPSHTCIHTGNTDIRSTRLHRSAMHAYITCRQIHIQYIYVINHTYIHTYIIILIHGGIYTEIICTHTRTHIHIDTHGTHLHKYKQTNRHIYGATQCR